MDTLEVSGEKEPRGLVRGVENESLLGKPTTWSKLMRVQRVCVAFSHIISMALCMKYTVQIPTCCGKTDSQVSLLYGFILSGIFLSSCDFIFLLFTTNDFTWHWIVSTIYYIFSFIVTVTIAVQGFAVGNAMIVICFGAFLSFVSFCMSIHNGTFGLIGFCEMNPNWNKSRQFRATFVLFVLPCVLIAQVAYTLIMIPNFENISCSTFGGPFVHTLTWQNYRSSIGCQPCSNSIYPASVTSSTTPVAGGTILEYCNSTTSGFYDNICCGWSH